MMFEMMTGTTYEAIVDAQLHGVMSDVSIHGVMSDVSIHGVMSDVSIHDAIVDVPMWTSLFTHRYTYLLFAILLVIGLYMVVVSSNLVKKIIGLNLFQTSVFLFFVSTAYVRDEDGEAGSAPVVPEGGAMAYDPFASPLPHVIVLTAIVVGVALTAVGLALVVRIYSEYGTLDEETLREVRADD